ncbi:DNA adenine methylase [Candidatus Peregrinibacteria bacterium]|nr:DNA adenine methylase [Candidatus Peregrinibacteria bacterium]
MFVTAQKTTKIISGSKIVKAEPFVKWAGGKRQLLPELRKYIPTYFDRYIEPFVGGGALFFDLLPDRAVLNDSNDELINAYLVIRDNVDELIENLEKYKYCPDLYYELREQDPSRLDSVSLSARFIYLNKCCFNGLYRVNKAGKFNVPIGSYVNPRICDSEKLRAVSCALQDSIIECSDYKEILYKYARKGDFIYIDPPYHPISKYSDFKRYTKEFFYEEDQCALKDIILDLKKCGCSVVASNSYCDFVLELYKDFQIEIVETKRYINKHAAGRNAIQEVIIL